MTLKLLLKICAVIVWIVGVIEGFVLANVDIDLGYSHYSDFLWNVALSTWATAFLFGLIFFVLSRIVEYLNAITEHLGIKPVTPTAQPSAPAPTADKDDPTKFQGITINSSSGAEKTEPVSPRSETK